MVVRLRPVLLSHASRMLGDGDAAEDVVQDTLLKMWTMRERLSDYSKPDSLAMVIVRNRCLDILKSPASHAADIEEARAIASDMPGPHRLLATREAVTHAIEAMDSLPPAVAAIMRMRHVDGLETEEIAATLGSTVESVRVSLSRGRKRMKEMIDHSAISGFQ